MPSQYKKISGSKAELTVSVTYAEYQKAERKALEQINKEMKVDGFRSGHIPEAVVRERAGKQVMEGMTLEFALPDSYMNAVAEHKLQPVGRPNIEIKQRPEKEGDELTYVATVEVMTEVKLGDYKKIKVKKPEVKVEQKEVDETLQMILDRFAEWKDVDRPAKEGDRVEADFEGFDEEGKAIANTASKNHPIVLGAKAMIPGFEEALMGAKKGEHKEFKITFPAEYHAKEMQGRNVSFKATVGRIEEKVQKELTPEMVKQVTGKDQTVQEFCDQVKEDLRQEMQRRSQQEHDSKVVQEVIKITQVELPETLVQQELAVLKEEQKSRIQSQGLQWDQYLSHIKKTEEDFDKDHRKSAEERLKARLGIHQIIQQEKIRASDDEVEAEVAKIIARYPQDQQGNVKDYYQPGSEGYRNLRNSLSADKLIGMLTAS